MGYPMIGQIGNQLFYTLHLFDKTVYNPDSVMLNEFERMLNTDETVGAAYDFLVLSVVNLIGNYNHPNKEINDFINKCLERMQDTLVKTASSILSAIWAGYSVTEIVWKAEGTSILLDKLVTYHPKSIHFSVNKKGQLESVQQYDFLFDDKTDIPIEKCITYTHGEDFGNHYGKSSFKRIRKNWLLKDAFLKMWARGLDKYGTPMAIAIVPDGQVIDPDTKELVSQLEYATKMLQSLQNGTGMALSVDTNKSNSNIPDVKVTFPGSNVGESFNQAINYLNKMICRGLLIPSLVFDEGARSGSYALGASHFDAFMMGVKGIYNKLTDIILDKLIRRLIEYNFGPQISFGSFQLNLPDPGQTKAMSEIFVALTNAGFIDPNVEEDFKHVRTITGLPPREMKQSRLDAIKSDYTRYKRAKSE